MKKYEKVEVKVDLKREIDGVLKTIATIYTEENNNEIINDNAIIYAFNILENIVKENDYIIADINNDYRKKARYKNSRLTYVD